MENNEKIKDFEKYIDALMSEIDKYKEKCTNLVFLKSLNLILGNKFTLIKHRC